MPVGESVIRLFLVRHGRVHNPRRLAYGYLPRMGLDPSGRAQAERAGTWLCSWRPVAVYTSPLLRALQTTRAILPRLLGCADVAGASGPTGPLAPAGPPVHRSSLLRESELARYWQGTPIDERPARFPEEWRLFSQ
ncbi:MAG: histidine phosphatase family protein, partial [Dehalococcoidia bacterium]